MRPLLALALALPLLSVEVRPAGGAYEVLFRYTPVIAVRSVAVAGGFNDWRKDANPMQDADGDGTWEASLRLPRGRHLYKFVINDGQEWRSDPDNPEDEPDGVSETGRNSVLLLGGPGAGRAVGDPLDGEVDAAELRHDGSLRFRNRVGDRLRVRLRTLRDDVAQVDLAWGAARLPMDRVGALGRHDWWEVWVRAERRRYHFSLHDGKVVRHLGPEGLAERPPGEASFVYDPTTSPRFQPPGWVADAVFYQVFPERLANGDPANDPKGTLPWGSPPENANFMGGDLQGVIDRLGALQELGVTALYLNPIFRAVSNHKYDTADYMAVDPHLGGEEAFGRLVEACRERGLRLLLDGVFNHTGDEFWAFEDIKARGRESPYLDWYFVREFPVVVRKDPGYDAWWGFGDLPKLNTANPDVKAYLYKVAVHWLRRGASGWRLDVPNELPSAFWTEFRRRVKSVAPEAYICGEIWNDATPWLQGDQFDAVMHYELRTLVLDFFGRSAIDAGTFADGLAELRLRYPEQVLPAMFHLLGSHDTIRLRTACGDDPRRHRLAALFQLGYLGAPVIYYGDEVGLSGGKDPECRRCYPWEDPPDPGLREWYRRLIALRRAHPALRRGAVRTLVAEGPHLVLERGGIEGGGGRLLLAFNNGPEDATLTVPVAGPWEDLIRGGTVAGEGGTLSLPLEAWSGTILRAGP
ncbi:MAG: alpha amylase N-terminal ig-like domain-containing protein [Planctomycetes bacterium]|nr:alpha amylase N-terminal ig-like domain-containing protein [Planctomycetota bacterium]